MHFRLRQAQTCLFYCTVPLINRTRYCLYLHLCPKIVNAMKLQGCICSNLKAGLSLCLSLGSQPRNYSVVIHSLWFYLLTHCVSVPSKPIAFLELGKETALAEFVNCSNEFKIIRTGAVKYCIYLVSPLPGAHHRTCPLCMPWGCLWTAAFVTTGPDSPLYPISPCCCWLPKLWACFRFTQAPDLIPVALTWQTYFLTSLAMSKGDKSLAPGNVKTDKSLLIPIDCQHLAVCSESPTSLLIGGETFYILTCAAWPSCAVLNPLEKCLQWCTTVPVTCAVSFPKQLTDCARKYPIHFLFFIFF